MKTHKQTKKGRNNLLAWIAFVALAWIPMLTLAEPQVRNWSRICGSVSNEYGFGLALDSLGYAYVAGLTEAAFNDQTNNGIRNACLVRYHPAGCHSWTRIWGATDYTEAHAVACDSQDNIYVTGQTWGGMEGQWPVGNGDFFLTEFSPSGSSVWTRIWGSSRMDSGEGVAVDASNFVYVVGYARTNFADQPSYGLRDFCLTKYAPDGTQIWVRLWGSTEDDYGQAVAVDATGGVYVAGYTYGSVDGEPFHGSCDICLTKYTAEGIKEWTRQWGGGGTDRGRGVSVGPDGLIYVTGDGGAFNGQLGVGAEDPFLLQVTPAGDCNWTRIWGSVGTDAGYAVTVNQATQIYVTGLACFNQVFDGQGSLGGIFLTRFTADGESRLSRRWGALDAEGHGVAAKGTNDVWVGGYTAAGFDCQPAFGPNDLFFTRWAAAAPPEIITGPTALNITATSAEIQWVTDKDADSLVRYGRSAGAYTWSATDTNNVTEHAVVLTGLTAAATYRYRVTSVDALTNSVSSRECFFTTAGAGGDNPLLTNLTVRSDGLFPIEIGVQTTDDVDHIDFYLDGRYVGTVYSPVDDFYLTPHLVTNDPASFVGDHTIRAEAFTADGHHSEATTVWTFDRTCWGEAVEVVADILQPWPGYTINTFSELAPITNILVEVNAKENMGYRITWGGAGRIPGPHLSDDLEYVADWQPVKRVDFFRDGILRYSSTNGLSDDPFIHRYECSLTGLHTGRHTITVHVVTSNDCVYADSTYFVVQHAPPSLEVTRRVIRNGTYFQVITTITNPAASANYALLMQYYEPMLGFMAYAAESPNFTVSNPADSASRRCALEFKFRFFPGTYLDPGESIDLHYEAIPVLSPGAAEYAIGGEGHLTFSDGFGSYSNSINLHTIWVSEGSRTSLVAAAVGNACAESDYLMITSPRNLLMRNSREEVNNLLSLMVELAVARRGILGFYDPRPVTMTPLQNGYPLVGGNVLKQDRGDVYFLYHTEDQDYIKAYQNQSEATIQTDSQLPIRLGSGVIHTEDALAIGNVCPALSGAPHPLDELLWVHGRASDPNVGLAVIYQYDSTTDHFSNSTFQTTYAAGDGFAVGDIVDGPSWNGDEILVANGDNGVVDVWGELNPTRHVQITNAFRAGDSLLTGYVLGGRVGNVIVADRSADKIIVYNLDAFPTVSETVIDQPLDEHDCLAVGDVLGNELDEIIVGRIAEGRIYIYGVRGGRLQCVAQYPFLLIHEDIITVANMFRQTKKEIVVARRMSEAGVSRGEVEIMSVAAGEMAGDRFGLDELINEGGGWGRQMNPDWRNMGSILLVGETAIIPAFSRRFDLGFTGIRHVRVTDINYANLDGTLERPELSIGRIPGDFASNLIAGLQSSLALSGGTASLTNDRAMIVSGYRRGPTTNSADINFVDQRRMLASTLRNRNFSTLEYTTEGPGAINAIALLSLATNNDVVYLTGHGSWDGWDILEAQHVNNNFFPTLTRPLVFAASCLTGYYPPGRGLAESFLGNGAAAYIGATDLSFGEFSLWLARPFFDNLGDGISLGLAFKNAQRHRAGADSGTSRRLNKYHNSIYHLFGDPKVTMGFPPTRRARGLRATEELEGPLATLPIVIPAYVVTNYDDSDHVEIPDQTMVLEPGKPSVPSYTLHIRYPAPAQVQDVTMSARGGLSFASGLNISNYTPLVEGLYPPRAPSETPGPDWWPTNDFAWWVDKDPDGSTLILTIYPFFYNASTKEAMFYSNYTFAVSYADSPVKINRWYTDKPVYGTNETILAHLYLYNTNSQGGDVVAVPELRSAENGAVQEQAFPIRTLRQLRGLAPVTFEISSATLAPGDYELELLIATPAGVVLGRDITEFTVGSADGRMSGVTLAPEAFRRGDNLDLSATFENTGDQTLDGTLVIEVQNSFGNRIAEFRQEFTNLARGSSTSFATTWTNASVVPRDCQVYAYALYDGAASVVNARHSWTNAPLLWDTINLTPQGVCLFGPSVSGRTYGIEVTTNLMTGPFQPIAIELPATPPQNIYTDSFDRGGAIYRWRESAGAE